MAAVGATSPLVQNPYIVRDIVYYQNGDPIYGDGITLSDATPRILEWQANLHVIALAINTLASHKLFQNQLRTALGAPENEEVKVNFVLEAGQVFVKREDSDSSTHSTIGIGQFEMNLQAGIQSIVNLVSRTFSPDQTTALQRENEALQQQVTDLSEQIRRVQAENHGLQQANQDQQAAIVQLQREVASLQANLSSEKSAYDLQLQELKQQHEQEIAKKTAEIAALDARIQDLSEELSARPTQQDVANLQARIAQLNSEKASLAQEHGAAIARLEARHDQAIQAQKVQIANLTKQLQAAQSSLQQTEAANRALQQLQASQQESIAAKDREITALQKEVEQLKTKPATSDAENIASLEKQIAKLQSEKEELTQNHEQALEQLSSTHRSTLEENQSTIARLTAELDEAKAELTEVTQTSKQELERLTQTYTSALVEKDQTSQGLQAQLRDLTSQNNQNTQALEAACKELQALEIQLAELKSSHARKIDHLSQTHQAAIREKEDTIEGLEAQIREQASTIQSQAADLESNSREIDQLHRSLSANEELLAFYGLQLGQQGETIEALEATIASLTNQLSRAEEQASKIRKLDSRLKEVHTQIKTNNEKIAALVAQRTPDPDEELERQIEQALETQYSLEQELNSTLEAIFEEIPNLKELIEAKMQEQVDQARERIDRTEREYQRELDSLLKRHQEALATQSDLSEAKLHEMQTAHHRRLIAIRREHDDAKQAIIDQYKDILSQQINPAYVTEIEAVLESLLNEHGLLRVDHAKLQEKLEELQLQMQGYEALKQAQSTAEATITKLQGQIASLEASTTETEQRHATAMRIKEEALAAATRRAETLDKEIEQARRNISAKEREIADRDKDIETLETSAETFYREQQVFLKTNKAKMEELEELKRLLARAGLSLELLRARQAEVAGLDGWKAKEQALLREVRQLNQQLSALQREHAGSILALKEDYSNKLASLKSENAQLRRDVSGSVSTRTPSTIADEYALKELCSQSY